MSTLIFFVLFLVLVSSISSVFKTSGIARDLEERFNRFYEEPRDSMDVIFFGSSAVYCYIIPEIAWNNYGITSFPLASNAEVLPITRYVIENALKYQSPEIIVIDMRAAWFGPSESGVAYGRDTLSMMPYSMTRLNATRSILSFQEEFIPDKDVASFYFPFLIFHSRWKSNLGMHDFTRVKSEFMGYPLGQTTTTITPADPLVFSDDAHPPEEKVQEALTVLLDYCDTLDNKILFVASPLNATNKEQYAAINYAFQIVEERGYPSINFNDDDMFEALRLDPSIDFFNQGHVNVNGAIKYTNYMFSHLKETYTLPDHRGDDSYTAWDTKYEKFARAASKSWREEFGEANRPLYTNN